MVPSVLLAPPLLVLVGALSREVSALVWCHQSKPAYVMQAYLHEPLIVGLLRPFLITAICLRQCITFLFTFVLYVQNCILYILVRIWHVIKSITVAKQSLPWQPPSSPWQIPVPLFNVGYYFLSSLSMVRGHKAQALWPVANLLNLLKQQFGLPMVLILKALPLGSIAGFGIWTLCPS